MKVLVIGSGGREHALVRALARHTAISVTCTPGNAGIARDARTETVDSGAVDELCALADRERFDLTIVGPELPLDRGIVDRFRAAGHRIFGPSQIAAQLECSKSFAKAFMTRHGIPTARFRVCDSAADALETIARGELGLPIVIKADGLAAGKGVVVAADRHEAERTIRAMMEDRQFGAAGARVVLEECLTGPEVSFFAVCDGRRAVDIGTAQDHKRIFDGDRGPNTGGMGAFAPSPLVDAELRARVQREIVDPVVRGMRAEGHEYRGFLYAGLMLTCDGPRVIEFNVRFGDPEAQVVLPLIEGDLPGLLVCRCRWRSRNEDRDPGRGRGRGRGPGLGRLSRRRDDRRDDWGPRASGGGLWRHRLARGHSSSGQSVHDLRWPRPDRRRTRAFLRARDCRRVRGRVAHFVRRDAVPH